MMSSRGPWVVLLVLGFAGAFALAKYVGRDSQATELPGAVVQSASAESQGVAIEVVLATFSGTAVHVDLSVRTEDDGRTLAGIAPTDTSMNGAGAENTYVGTGGHMSLRFPVAAWPADVATTTLVVGAVHVRDGSNEVHRVEGEWVLDVRLPEGEAADAARAVQALEPVMMSVGQYEVPVETFRTQGGTLIRYELPATVVPTALMLRAGEKPLLPTLAEQRQLGPQEVWFPATPDDVPLVLIFEQRMVSDPDGKAWTLEFDLGAFDPPGEKEGMQERHLDFEIRPESSGPELLDVLWERRIDLDVHLTLTVAGLWDPGANGFPVAFGDDSELRVYHVGLRPAQNGKPDHTIITLELRAARPPRHVALRFAGETTMVPKVEVALRP